MKIEGQISSPSFLDYAYRRFLISFSFQMTKENNKSAAETEEWKKEYALRDELLKQEKENKKFEKELYQK